MSKYIHIEDSCFSEMKMDFAEAVLYSLVAGYVNNGKKFICKQGELATRFNVSRRVISYQLENLVKKGYLEKVRMQAGIEYTLSDNWRCEDFVHQDEQKRNSRCTKKLHPDEQKRNITHYILNNNIKPNNKGENGEKSTLQGIALELFCRHFKETHEGREYTPNHATNTDTFYELCDKIKSRMTTDGYVADPDTFSTYFGQWIALAWQKTDNWHWERWSAEFVNSQFTYFDNIVNSKENGNQRKTNNHGGNSEISDAYIAKQFERIERSRAARAAGNGAERGEEPRR